VLLGLPYELDKYDKVIAATAMEQVRYAEVIVMITI